ncbi:MAG TPA: 3-hydroxyacyl-CoA dehydrogenase NAD-binding domain-containing protein, partial [Bacillales bacterium]
MSYESNAVKRIAVVGTGVIGNGWIARCLARGYDVVATDPAEGSEERMRASVDRIWPTLERTGIDPSASRDRLHFESDLKAAVSNADLIQECVPEREDLKRKVLSQIDHVAKPDAIIASSTSGITATTLQSDCTHPERVVVAHPFHPVYLLPLVEVVGGKSTSAEIVKKAEAFYKSLDMKPLIVKQEIEGHIGDRLMEAIWREALHIV